MDRGLEPIRVIQDVMMHSNVIYIIGNHDYIMLDIMKKLTVEITEDNFENHLSEDELWDFSLWMQDGGEVTARQFSALSREERQDILEYLENAFLYEIKISSQGL